MDAIPDRALDTARTLARRLGHSSDELRKLLPVTGTELAYMPEKFRTEADALFHRFLTLHSLLSHHILPAALGGTRDDLPVAAAAAGLVTSPDVLAQLSALRSRLCEGFPTEPAAEATLLNEIAAASQTLRGLLDRAETALAARG